MPFAREGFRITCLELGASLAQIARANLASYRKVFVWQADFNTMGFSPATYDLAFSATAFHWLDPASRFQRVHDALRPGGTLALFWHRPVATDRSRAMVEALQSLYRQFAPELTRRYVPPPDP